MNLFKKNKDQDDLSISVFQLENLIDNTVPFLFFHLSSKHKIHERADKFIKHSKTLTKNNIKAMLKKEEDIFKPIVLICEKGNKSHLLARYLKKQGFVNVFFVEGGIRSLLKEEKEIL